MGCTNTFKWLEQLMEGEDGNRAIHYNIIGPCKIYNHNAQKCVPLSHCLVTHNTGSYYLT